jgi:hypothetical protein
MRATPADASCWVGLSMRSRLAWRPPTDGTPPELSAEQADATIRSRGFVVLLVVVAIIGVVVSVAALCFLEAIHQIQRELYTHLPNAVGYQHGPPKWWSLPILAVGALIVALAITRLPGNGGHIPAQGLSPGVQPRRASCRECSSPAWRRSASGWCWGRRVR